PTRRSSDLNPLGGGIKKLDHRPVIQIAHENHLLVEHKKFLKFHAQNDFQRNIPDIARRQVNFTDVFVSGGRLSFLKQNVKQVPIQIKTKQVVKAFHRKLF